ncbi:MAG TPA: hypothetical protein VGL80_25180 [Pseudonocardiaceae bacterium]|jgi:hypothetical protein
MGIDPAQLTFGSDRRHGHLRLAAVLSPQPRHRPSNGGPGTGYPDPIRHAQVIAGQLDVIRERHAHRADVLGIHPDLVMVIVFKRGISGMDALLGKAGLQFLAASGREAIAAFSSDPEMITFLHHLQLYGRGTATQKTPHQQQLFGAIHKVRPLTPEDVLDPDVRQAAAHTEVRMSCCGWTCSAGVLKTSPTPGVASLTRCRRSRPPVAPWSTGRFVTPRVCP